MTKGIDCATRITPESAAAFRADGHAFVGRYLVPSGWKRLTKEEAKDISASGLQIVSVFETTANRALGGRLAGLTDGDTAQAVAKTIGQPEGSCIYFAVDFEPTNAQLPEIVEYIRGAADKTPGYTTGVYGCARVIKACQAAGVCSRFWQCKAWSRGEVVPGIHIYQHTIDISVHGIGVDLNDCFGNEGSWSTVQFQMSPDDANKIISLLSGAYGATEDKEAQAEYHRLANELRKASGQPTE